MMKGLIFFCCACCILLFTIINLSIGPIINGKISTYRTWNCDYYRDLYDDAKKGPVQLTDEQKKYVYEWNIKQCRRRKAMSNMECTAFIFDIVIGFVCGLLGLLHHFEVKKDFVSKTGLIGLCCGVVGFVLSLVYVIYNGIVYTNYYDAPIYKMNSKGAFAEWKGDKYECLYFDKKGNTQALIAKFSDLIKKQYNYDKDLLTSNEATQCLYSAARCNDYDDGKLPLNKMQYQDDNGNYHDCQYLFDNDNLNNIISIYKANYKDTSDRFLTTLILSLFVCLANIGLALFGFFLFQTPGEF